MKNKLLLFISLIISNISWGQSNCPVPPTKITPVVESKVSFDKKTNLYTYDYTVSNLGSDNLPIGLFMIRRQDNLTTTQGKPYKWIDGLDTDKEYYQWSSAIKSAVKPNQKVSGFKLISSSPPGIGKFYAYGQTTGELIATPTDGDLEAYPDCPGFWEDVDQAFDDFVIGAVTVPVSTPQAVVDLKMKLNKKDCHDDTQISPLDEGKIELRVKSKDLDLSDIDLTSLRFGFGQAKPISSQIVGKNKDKFLELEFNLADIGIRCDLDRSLFLSGQAKTKAVIGTVKIKPALCGRELWNKWNKKKGKKRVKFEH